MPNVSIEFLLAEKTGHSEQEVYKILASLAEILKEEVYDKGNLVSLHHWVYLRKILFQKKEKDITQQKV